MEKIPEEELICRPGGFALTDRMLEVAFRYPIREFPEKACVLDIGCGEGASVRRLRRKFPFWNVLGADPDPPQGTGFFRAEAESLPFPDGSFDLILMECVLSRVKDPDRALEEIKRVLREGGRLLLSDLYTRSELPLAAGGAREAGPGKENGPESPAGRLQAGRLQTAAGIQDSLSRAGFAVLSMEDCPGELAAFAGQRILEGGKDLLEQDLGMSLAELKAAKCGYFTAVAEVSDLWREVRYAAKESPFYRKLWEEAGESLLRQAEEIRPGDWETFRKLPFSGPEDIRRKPEEFLAVNPKEIARVITLKTSGSSGNPKRLFFTADDLERTADFFNRGIRYLVQPGFKVMVFMEGPAHWSVGGLLAEGLRHLPAETFVYGLIRDYRDAAHAARGMDTLIGVPAQMRALCAEAPDLRPKTVLLSADYVPESVKKVLEDTWQAKVFTHWGMTETGYGGGVQCGAREGYHLREDDLYLEVLDPAAGTPVEPGETGEIVLTTLHRRGMPLIRYRTGDLARMVMTPCPCGALHPRLGKVMGRLGDAVLLENGRVLSMPVLDELLSGVPGLEDFAVSWTEEKRELAVTIKRSGGSPAGEVRRILEAHFGGLAEIRTEYGDVNSPAGPAKRQIAGIRRKDR